MAAFWAALCLAEELAWETTAREGLVETAAKCFGIGTPAACTILSVLAALVVALVAALVAAAVRAASRSRRVNEKNTPDFSLSASRARVSWRQGGSALPATVAAAFALGLVCGGLCWGEAAQAAVQVDEAGGPYRLAITSDCSAGAYGSYSEGELSTLGSGAPSVRVRVQWSDASQVLPLGAECTAHGSFRRYFSEERNRRHHQNLVMGAFKPYVLDDVGWAPTLQGLFGPVRQHCVELAEAAGAALGERSPGYGAAIMRGIVLGDRSSISGTELDESFKLAGLAHLLAVSGSHMSIVTVLVAWVLGRLGASRRATVIALSAMVVCYLVLSAVQPSAFRACIMAVVGASSFFARRRANSFSALVIAVGVLLVVDPSNAFSVGFVLSVLGVAGLCIFLPLASLWMQRLLPDALGKAASPLAMTLTAQFATSPVAVPSFSMISVVGPLCNMVAAPAIALLLGMGLVSFLIALLIEPVGMLLLEALCTLGDVLGELVVAVAGIPFSAIPVSVDPIIVSVLTLAAAALIWILWPLPSRRTIRKAVSAVLASGAFVSLLLASPAGTSVVVMDVGQGDAILVRSRGRQILIDTGQYDSVLRDALGRNRVYHLDAVVLTHFDADHCGALGAMRSMVAVDRVIVAEGAIELANSDESAREVIETAARVARGEERVVEIGLGTTIALSDELSLEVVWPDHVATGAGNADSLCLLARYDSDADDDPEFQALFTGDAEKDELSHMVEEGLGDIDVLKVGHHGSSVTVDDETLDVIRPELALISVGAGNRYGHPTAAALDALARHGAAIFRTDLNGDITVAFAPESLTVTCATME